MKTYDLNGAAEFLHTSESTLEAILKTGDLPAAKHGKSWCLLEDDLVEYHRKQAQIQMEQMRSRGKVSTSFSQNKAARDTNRRTPKPELPDLEEAA